MFHLRQCASKSNGRAFEGVARAAMGRRSSEPQRRGKSSSTQGSCTSRLRSTMTKMVCTLGPASLPPDNPDGLQKLVEEGMGVARFNFSHVAGNYPPITEALKALRSAKGLHHDLCSLPASGEIKPANVRAALLDTKGPEIRTGILADGLKKITLEKGTEVVLSTDLAHEELTTPQLIFVDYAALGSTVSPGGMVLLDDGLVELEVLEVSNATSVRCLVRNTGSLQSRKGVNLPGCSLQLPAMTEQDKLDLKFGVEAGFDFVAASFVRKASDVRAVQAYLERCCEAMARENGDYEGPHNVKKRPLVISKIENSEGVDNFDEILEASEGIMVARGDLGVEIPFQQVLMLQKELVRKCNLAGKPVIVATQMLDSMMTRPRPTRAEVTDVGNAVLDGADAVMLSGETANGLYSTHAANTMITICHEADRELDRSAERGGTLKRTVEELASSDVEVMASSAVKTAQKISADLIIVLTRTGASARLITKFRPAVPVMAFCSDVSAARALMLHRALYPVVMPSVAGNAETDRIVESVRTAKELGWVKAGDKVVLFDTELIEASSLQTKTRCVKVFEVPG